MRLTEILLERSSFTDFGRRLKEQIMNNLPANLNRFYKSMAEEMFGGVDQDRMTVVESKMEIQHWLNGFFDRQMRSALKEAGFTDVGFSFVDYGDESTHGTYDHKNKQLRVTSTYLKQLTDVLYSFMESYYTDNNYKVALIVDLPYDTPEIVGRIVSVMVHEITHGGQFRGADQKMGRNSADTYRSYIERDKKKFWQMVNSAAGSKAYYGSPQEIDAFAQQLVYDMLEWYDDQKINIRLSAIDELMQEIASSVDGSTSYHKFKGSNDPTEKKVRQRMLKRVYQELDSRRDQLLKTLQQQKHRPQAPGEIR